MKPVICQSDSAVSSSPADEQEARIDPVDDAADDHHGDHGADAARRHHEPAVITG